MFVKEETYCISLQEFDAQLTTLLLVYITPRHVICNGDFSLLRIKSWDVTP